MTRRHDGSSRSETNSVENGELEQHNQQGGIDMSQTRTHVVDEEGHWASIRADRHRRCGELRNLECRAESLKSNLAAVRENIQLALVRPDGNQLTKM